MKYLKKTLKYIAIIYITGLIASIVYAFWFALAYFDTSRDKSEAYVIDIKTQKNAIYLTSFDIVNYLYEFQCSHPQYRLMETDEEGNEYHYFSPDRDIGARQRMVFFYCKDIDMLFSCIIEVTPRNNPLIKLYYVNDGPIIRHPEKINNYKEISREKNKKMKKKFEADILDNLGVGWRHKRFWD